MLATTCQISRIDGSICEKASKGFVVVQGDSPMSIYKAGVVLCSRHGEAVRDVTPNSVFLTKSELAELMNGEGLPQAKPAAPPVLEVLPSAPADLQALAAHLNASSVDSAPTPKVVEQTPAAPEAQPEAQAKPEEQTKPDAAKPKVVCPEAAVILAQVKTLRDTIAIVPALAGELTVKAEALELQAKHVQDAFDRSEALKYAKGFVVVRHPKGEAWLKLRSAIYLGGFEALEALDNAIEEGLLGSTKKKAINSEKKDDKASSDTSKPVSTTPVEKTDAEARRAEVIKHIALGWTDSMIAKAMGINASTVYSTRKSWLKKQAA